MNTWQPWGLDGHPPIPAGIILHSTPPLLVLLAAEVGPGLREQLALAASAADDTGRADKNAPCDEAAVHEQVRPHDQQTSDIHERRDVHESSGDAAHKSSHRSTMKSDRSTTAG